MGTQVADIATCNKVYAKLSADFYVERAGDKSVNFANITINSKCSEENKATAFADFFSKVKEGILFSFFQRCAQYDSDIRRLDSFRGSPQFDFRQLFLVKESLALMYQLMQLPQEALRQYSELEALLSVIPLGTLPHNDWPLAVAEDLRATSRAASVPASVEEVLPSAETMIAVNIAGEYPYATGEEISATMWRDPMGEGENVLLYSINSARMKILKNKIGIRELKRYLFARQIHFLAQQHKCRECALKGLLYVTDTYASIVFQLPESKSLVCTRRWQADLWFLNAAVRIVRSCRMYIAMQQEQEQKEFKTDLASSADITDSAAHEVVEKEAGQRLKTGLDAITESNMSIKRPAGIKEVQLLRDASQPLRELLSLAINKLHSLSSSLMSHPFSRSLGFIAEREAVLEGVGIRDLYLTHIKRSSFYREEALNMSKSLHPTRSSAHSEYDCSRAARIEYGIKHSVLTYDCDNPPLKLVTKKVTHSEVEIQSVEEALQTDIDKVSVKRFLDSISFTDIAIMLSSIKYAVINTLPCEGRHEVCRRIYN